MSNTFKFIEVLNYGSGYDADKYTGYDGDILVVDNGAVILESIVNIVGNSNINIPSIEMGLLNSVPHYTGNTLPYILEDTAVYISNIGDMTGINELHTTKIFINDVGNDNQVLTLSNNLTGECSFQDAIALIDFGTASNNNILIWNSNNPNPLIKDSTINIDTLTSTMTGVQNYVSNVSEITNFNISNVLGFSSEYNFNILDNPALKIYTENPTDADQYFVMQSTSSNSIIPGPLLGTSSPSQYFLVDVPSNGAMVLLDNQQDSTPALIFVGGSNASGGFVGITASSDVISDNTIYTLPTNIGTTDGEVLICSNTTAELSWTPLTYPNSFIIPWTSFEWFVLTGGGSDLYNATADAQNGTAFSGTPNRTFGAGVSFIIPVSGTWRFTVNFKTGNNCGIARFLIDGVQTDVDTYTAANEGKSYSWTQTINAGERNVVLSSLTKNGSSSNYWLLPMYNGITVIKE